MESFLKEVLPTIKVEIWNHTMIFFLSTFSKIYQAALIALNATRGLKNSQQEDLDKLS